MTNCKGGITSSRERHIAAILVLLAIEMIEDLLKLLPLLLKLGVDLVAKDLDSIVGVVDECEELVWSRHSVGGGCGPDDIVFLEALRRCLAIRWLDEWIAMVGTFRRRLFVVAVSGWTFGSAARVVGIVSVGHHEDGVCGVCRERGKRSAK